MLRRGMALVFVTGSGLWAAAGCGGDTSDAKSSTGGSAAACAPGDTRQCQGSTSCVGGQMCTPSGSWGACDCGGGGTAGSGGSPSGGGGGSGSGGSGSGGSGGSGSGGSGSGGAPTGGSGGTSAGGSGGGVTFTEPCGNPSGVTGQGLQYSGSVSLLRPKPGSPGQQQRVSVSAPIHPSVIKLYPGEGPNYPTTQSAREQLAKDSALTFCFLIGACKPSYPQLKTAEPLSASELATNYAAIADCAYLQYGGKPYWIPKLIEDVEICTLTYGAGWHVPTEQLLNELTEADYTTLQQKLVTLGSGNSYFNLHVWARDKAGAVALGDMTPGVSPRVKPLPVSGDQLKIHHESDHGLRCVRLQDL